MNKIIGTGTNEYQLLLGVLKCVRAELGWLEPERVSQSMSEQLRPLFLKSRVLRNKVLKV